MQDREKWKLGTGGSWVEKLREGFESYTVEDEDRCALKTFLTQKRNQAQVQLKRAEQERGRETALF